MNRVIASVLEKLAEIKKLSIEIEEELAKLQEGDTKEHRTGGRRGKPPEEIPSAEVLRSKFDDLYSRVNQGDRGAVQSFVEGNSSKYLDAFCRANNLLSDGSKVAKTRMAEEILRSIAQRRAISKTSI